MQLFVSKLETSNMGSDKSTIMNAIFIIIIISVLFFCCQSWSPAFIFIIRCTHFHLALLFILLCWVRKRELRKIDLRVYLKGNFIWIFHTIMGIHEAASLWIKDFCIRSVVSVAPHPNNVHFQHFRIPRMIILSSRIYVDVKYTKLLPVAWGLNRSTKL